MCKHAVVAGWLAIAMAQAQTWTVPSPATSPTGLNGASIAFDKANSRTVVFGGDAANLTPANETWLWDGTTWSKAAPAASPSARRGHAMVFDEQRNEVVLFGGWANAYSYFGDTWTWNGANWTQKTPAVSPSARANFALAYDPVRKQTILFGGASMTGVQSAETWAWDGTNWTLLVPASSPTARQGASMAWDPVSQRLILYGGTSWHDTWAWNGTTWSEVTPAGTQPGAMFAPLVTHGSKLLLQDYSETLWKMWLWDGAAWQPLMVSNDPPAPYFGVAAAYDSVRDRSVFFGGQAASGGVASGNPVNTTRLLDLGNACTFPNTPPAPINVTAQAGTLSLPVPAPVGCAWSVQMPSGFLSRGATVSGTGPGNADVFYSANSSNASRTSTVSVGGSRVYTVVQAGVPCSTSATLPPSPITMSNGCSATWTYNAKAGEQIAFRGVGRGSTYGPRDGAVASYPSIRVNAPDASVLVLAANSSAAFPFVFAPSPGVLTFPSAGTYSITFSASGGDLGSSTLEYMKAGDACNTTPVVYKTYGAFPLSTIQPGFASEQDVLGIAVPPGCPSVTASTSASWLTLGAGPYGPGYSTANLGVATNYGAARSGTFTVGGSAYTVSQGAAVCSFSLASPSVSVGNGRTSATVNLTTSPGDCAWTGSSDSTWAQPYPLSGNGSAAVQYTVFPNYSTKTRTATLSIAGQPFTITQAPGTGTAAERFVKLLYFSFFGRIPSDAEVAFQVNSGQSRAQLASNFFHSAEFNSGGRYVAGMYIGVLGRDAEYGGWLFQRDALATGVTTSSTFATNIVYSTEYGLRYGDYRFTEKQFIPNLYRNVLLRQPTLDEYQFQVSALSKGVSFGEMARSFVLSPEFGITAGPRLTAFLAYAALLQRQATDAEMTAGGNVARQAQNSPDVASLQAYIRDNLLGPIVNSAEFNKLLE